MAKQKEQKPAAKKEKLLMVSIPKLEVGYIDLQIVGDSDLITHAWSPKAIKQMLDKQMKKAQQGREAKDPALDYRESLYWLDKDGNRIDPLDIDPAKHLLFGFKAIAFKSAAVRAATDVGLAMTDTRRAFHVMGEFVRIEFESVRMREDPVILNGKTADLRYRAEFHNWSCKLRIRYNKRIYSPEQIVNLFNTAGFGVGVGEWRVERNGSSGMFHVA